MRRSIVLWWLIIVIDYVRIIQSVGEFINENETEIVSILEPKLLLQQDVTFEGSGPSTEISTMMSEVTGTASQATGYTSIILTSTVDFTLSLSESTATDTIVTGISEQTITYDTSVTAETSTSSTIIYTESSPIRTTSDCLPYSSTSVTLKPTITMNEETGMLISSDTTFQTNPYSQESTIEQGRISTLSTVDPCAFVSSTELPTILTTIESTTSTIHYTMESTTTPTILSTTGQSSSSIEYSSSTSNGPSTNSVATFSEETATFQTVIPSATPTITPTTEFSSTSTLIIITTTIDDNPSTESSTITFPTDSSTSTSIATNTISSIITDTSISTTNSIITDISVNTESSTSTTNSIITDSSIITESSAITEAATTITITTTITTTTITTTTDTTTSSITTTITTTTDTTTSSITTTITTTTDTTTSSITTTITTTTDTTTSSITTTATTTTDTTTSSITTTATTTTSSITTTTTSYDNCKNDSVILVDGRCEAKNDIKNKTAGILRGNLNNITDNHLAGNLSLHISSITKTNVRNLGDNLGVEEVDALVKKLNSSLDISTTESFLMAQQIDQGRNLTVLGASFNRNIGGKIVGSTIDQLNDSLISVGAIVSGLSLLGVKSLNILIIDKPIAYEELGDWDNTKLASSVIVLTVERNSPSSSTNVSLYFQVLNEYATEFNASYSCSYYDTKISQWSNALCSVPKYNSTFKRYECSCNHLSTFALVWTRIITTCNGTTELSPNSGTCVPNNVARDDAVEILTGNSTDPTAIADALETYISVTTNFYATKNSSNTLSLDAIEKSLDKISNIELTRNTNQSYLIARSINPTEGIFILGASFTRREGGKVVNTSNKDAVVSSRLSTAAIISNESLIGVTSLNMLIIDDPTVFKKIEDPNNRTLVSSVILVKAQGNIAQINISLYFQALDNYNLSRKDNYYCLFYDTRSSLWNDSDCTSPHYNAQFNRYECSCNHLTSFALLWLPNVPRTRNLDAQDIASIVFQSISIVCFLCIIIHAIIIRLLQPLMSLRAFDLLPLISCASTTILFIFYIALGITAYTRTTDDDGTKCFLSSKVLMFFVYFFVLYMFCVKTSVGYFNYLRFVRLFPEPPRSKLFILLVILFFISLTWVAFAAGFDSNPSYHITELIPYKLCWFSRDVIHYFFTIPACIFLAINVILFLLVARRIIYHVQNATSPHQSYERMKRCVIVLLSSCLTQGIGWLLGPVITVANPKPAEVLSWIFVVFNGLEGLWSIILYAIIRSQRMDEQKRLVASKELTRSSTLPSLKGKKNRINDTNRSLSRRFRTTDRNVDKEWNTFNDFHSVESDDRSSSIC